MAHAQLEPVLASDGEELKMPNDEEAIIAETRAFEVAWNAADPEAAAAFYTEDGVRVGATGDTQQGRVEIEDAYRRLLGGPFAGASVTQERGSVRMLTADLALWRGCMQIKPATGGPIMNGHVVQIMKKVEGRWLILEAHPKLFPPPPQ